VSCITCILTDTVTLLLEPRTAKKGRILLADEKGQLLADEKDRRTGYYLSKKFNKYGETGTVAALGPALIVSPKALFPSTRRVWCHDDQS
jgi:hypothetical protein